MGTDGWVKFCLDPTPKVDVLGGGVEIGPIMWDLSFCVFVSDSLMLPLGKE